MALSGGQMSYLLQAIDWRYPRFDIGLPCRAASVPDLAPGPE